jgi:signal transduction protein with GAF and PtsI domain
MSLAPHPLDLSSWPDLASALTDILQDFSADVGTVHVLDSYGLLHLVASHGISEHVLDKLRTIPACKGIAGMAIERRQVVTFGNLQADAAGNVRPDSGAPGLKRVVALPIFQGDAVIGALRIETSNERSFSEVEIAALLDVGRSVAARFLASPQSNATWS